MEGQGGPAGNAALVVVVEVVCVGGLRGAEGVPAAGPYLTP